MNPNEALLWISAKREGSWARYKAAIEEMATLTGVDEDAPDEDEEIHQRLRFNLERLAHVEFRCREFPDGWRVVPPTIIYTKEGAGILCGARTEELLACIRNEVSEVQFTTQPYAPDCIELLGTGRLERCATKNKLFFQHKATESILAAIPPVDNRQMRTQCELPFGDDAPVHQFSARKLQWTISSSREARNASFGLFRWQLPYELHYYLKIRERAYRIPVQIGKYLVLRSERRRVLDFDRDKQILKVPVACRPPMLVDRALTLRTGILPNIEQGTLVYQNIPEAIALMTSAVLRQ